MTKSILLTSTLCLYAFCVCGQSALTDSTHRVGEVIILGADMTQKDVVPAQVLTGEELRSLNSLSVADALRYFSGVQVEGLWRRWRSEDCQHSFHGY